ncbi:Uncharacterised protein [uncultured archaeon]|nr:Uncharacterised protein [uncultured archaeon]
MSMNHKKRYDGDNIFFELFVQPSDKTSIVEQELYNVFGNPLFSIDNDIPVSRALNDIRKKHNIKKIVLRGMKE